MWGKDDSLNGVMSYLLNQIMKFTNRPRLVLFHKSINVTSHMMPLGSIMTWLQGQSSGPSVNEESMVIHYAFISPPPL